MDSLESVSAVHSRTVSGNKYVRIATSPIEADDQKAPATQKMDTTGFADSFVRTPIVVPVNLAVVVSYLKCTTFHVIIFMSCMQQEPKGQCLLADSNTSDAAVMPRKSSLKRKSSAAEVMKHH